MHVTLVHVHVKPEYLADFIAATQAHHLATRGEPGNLRFDVLQNAEHATQFVLYEVYANVVDAAAHKHTPHYLHWRDSVAPWMAQPRVGVLHQGLFPTERAAW